MAGRENSDSGKEKANDSVKLAIRDEVERRFDSPPASFVERIEKEVEHRVENREKIYRWVAIVAFVLITTFAITLWKVSLSTIRETVEKQLSEKEVVKAKEMIMQAASSIESQTNRVFSMTQSVEENQKAFVERLTEIKRQDNVVLRSDFIVQTVSNVAGIKRITLDYEPLPGTLKWSVVQSQGDLKIDYFGRLEGRTIILNEKGLGAFSNASNIAVKFEYVRKN